MGEYITNNKITCPLCKNEMINEWGEPNWPEDGLAEVVCDCRECGWSWSFVVNMKTDEITREPQRYFIG